MFVVVVWDLCRLVVVGCGFVEVPGCVCGFEPYAFLSHFDPKASVQKALSHQHLRSPKLKTAKHT